MSSEKIFIVNGEEISENQSQVRNNWIIAEKSGDLTISYWSGLHVFSILCCSGLAMSIMTLIPRHDSMADQSYWFEINILTATVYFIMTARMVVDFIVLFEKSSLITIRFFLKNYFATFLTWIVGFCITYIIWTIILEHNHPMPFTGAILQFPTKLASVLFLPLMLLRDFALEDETKKKLKSFLWFQLCWIPPFYIKIMLAPAFYELRDTDAQCVIALMTHMAKRLTSFFLSKMMRRIVGSDNERANITLTAQINIAYGVFTAISQIDSRPVTGICMVSIDALMQLIMTYQIVKLHKKVTVDGYETLKEQKRKAILQLVMAELCEGLVPLGYAISFGMAYYGPNAMLLGFCKDYHWQWFTIEDGTRTFLTMFGLFLMDVVCLAFNSSIIWLFCKVNLFKEICFVLKRYWYILALRMANDLWWNFYFRDVNFANDSSGKFRWLENDKWHVSLASNSTYV